MPGKPKQYRVARPPSRRPRREIYDLRFMIDDLREIECVFDE
jgi:hypothetical protein